ncbi:prephenate dehydrogenase [Pontibacter diazotrophicus]|uniref:Prephenate dehydrogenase n=1 Tax=Pontibacter diazotrophicus TaxID=1400979 RepID=A0A3D8LG03_9BACT|nr:prephenate dehydrogenase [Pontibacter diazotrophicus]RDV16323.1 prephenate dehydrogenase [Pontibacter diazotrophicus]
MIICVIGLGLLGGSFALGLKAGNTPVTILGVDNNPQHAKQALERGIADEVLPLEEAVSKAELVVLATPVNAILQQLPAVLDILPEGATLIDFGSTKQQLCDAVAAHPKRDQFVATHPIAGTEYSGPEAAFAALLEGKTMIICEKEKSRPASLAMVEKLCRSLHMPLRYMPAAEHDLHFAYVSHLSHISSFALGLTVLDKEKNEKNIFDMAGSGFSSTVRLAKSSPQMWGPIFSQNRENVSEALAGYIAQLQQFKEAIDARDEEQTKALMAKANDIRKILG